MNHRFLSYYERELRHFREMGGEFAEANPKIAGRLGLDEFECADPYVERLIESAAFMAARVQVKIDAQFPRFTEHLLETVHPEYLTPTPSMLVAQFQPQLSDSSLAEGVSIPRQTVLRGELGRGDQTACEYTLAHDLTLWPVELTEAVYHTQDVLSLNLGESGKGTKAALRLRFRATAGTTFDKLPLDALPLFLRGSESQPTRLYEQILGHAMKIIIRPAEDRTGPGVAIPASSLTRPGFDADQALFPQTAQGFAGYRLLREYFAFPARFLFVELTQLQKALPTCHGDLVDVIILLDEIEPALEGDVDAGNFALFCAPAINIFPKRADRIHLSDRFSEFHVVVDRTRPLDYEIYRVLEVTGYGSGQEQRTRFRPFYAARDIDSEADAAYFAISRVPRTRSQREQRDGTRSRYLGGEVYVSLVDGQALPHETDLRQLAVTTLCTNRDLAMQMPLGHGQTDFTCEGGGPIDAIRCVAGPTPPRPSFAHGEFAWRIVSHLSLNYLSLADTDEEKGAEALRELLRLYVQLITEPGRQNRSDPMLHQVDAVRSVTVKPITRRLPGTGPISFARGLEVTLTLDDGGFESGGAFLLGAVLEAFFAEYVSINSFTETVVRTLGRGEIMRWPMNLGRQPSF